jgi:hypothetical protein
MNVAQKSYASMVPTDGSPSNTVFDNLIAVFPNLYSKEFCDIAINRFEETYSAGFGFQHHWGPARKDSVVFSSDTVGHECLGSFYKEFNEIFWNRAYAEYKGKYEILESCAEHAIFSAKIQRSLVGEGYHQWHFDSSSRNAAGRLLVFILYLNDVEEGGETEFLYTPKRIKPKKGTLLIFPSSFTHAHRGNPPLSNTKYILTGWVEF